METIFVNSINDSEQDFKYLIELLEEVENYNYQANLDFSKCRFLRQNAVAMLGGILRLSQFKNGNVTIIWETLEKDILLNLLKNGFLEAFVNVKNPPKFTYGNAIPYREDTKKNPDSIMDYLKDKWLGRHWIKMSPLLSDQIVGKVWELYDNAFSHSRSPIGVISCGQYYPKQKELKLSIVDFGISIPTAVREFKKNPNIPSDKAIAWAFQRGTTTSSIGFGRGLGLDLFKKFVKLNKGNLEVYSQDGYAIINNMDEKFSINNKSFSGTIINITLKPNDSYYCLSSEIKTDTKFVF